jgi:hypothetical protein
MATSMMVISSGMDGISIVPAEGESNPEQRFAIPSLLEYVQKRSSNLTNLCSGYHRDVHFSGGFLPAAQFFVPTWRLAGFSCGHFGA